MWKRSLLPAGGLALLLMVALAGCGTQGYAAPLGQAARTPLTGAFTGSASFTPTYATLYATYFEGHLVPFVGAKTPVELRSGSCVGQLIANLTQASDQQPPAAPTPPLVQPDRAQPGVDVAIVGGANQWITVRAHPNDPNAEILACGQPLSGREQNFDLYPPSVGSDGMGLGFTKITPIVATALTISLIHPTSSAVAWVVRAGSCGGAAVGSGQLAKGATKATGFLFQTLDSAHWRLTLTPGATPAPSSGATACYPLT